jgi:hypothetical protein
MVRALDLALLCFLDIIWRVVQVCSTDRLERGAKNLNLIGRFLSTWEYSMQSMKECECSYLAKYMLVIASKFTDLKAEERNTYA